jgi:hypothetical protein
MTSLRRSSAGHSMRFSKAKERSYDGTDDSFGRAIAACNCAINSMAAVGSIASRRLRSSAAGLVIVGR